MYPYGTRYSTTGRSEDSRSKYPCLLRLDSTGEVSSDCSDESVKRPVCNNKTGRKMGISTVSLLPSNNFLTRKSLCSSQKGLCSSKQNFSSRDNRYNMNEKLTENQIMMEPTNALFANSSPVSYFHLPSCYSYCDLNKQSYKPQMRSQNLVFHPYVKQDMSASKVPSTGSNMDFFSNMSKTLQKPSKQRLPNYYLPKCKKKNRYNRYLNDKKLQASVPSENKKPGSQNSKEHSVKNPAEKKCSQMPVSISNSEVTATSEKVDISCKIEELSLGEKVAMKNALQSSKVDKEESEVDWFSLTRQVSEKDFAKIDMNQFDDESNENLCNIIHQEVRDLFSDIDLDCSKSNDGTSACQEAKSQENVRSDEIPSKCSSSERTQNEKQNTCNTEDFAKYEESVNIPMVLFVRENKKVRTSRRNRRKSSKKRTQDCSVKITCDSNKDEKTVKSGESPKRNTSHFNIHSFLIAISDSSSSCDSNSDWSDDDGEVDVDLLSGPEFSCPMSWNVICAMSNSENAESSPNSELDAINSAWKINITVNSSPRKPKQTDKKVHFANEDVLTVVHIAEDWSRKGPWEEYARDRERFKRRIADTETILSPILHSNHRQNILSKFHNVTE